MTRLSTAIRNLRATLEASYPARIVTYWITVVAYFWLMYGIGRLIGDRPWILAIAVVVNLGSIVPFLILGRWVARPRRE